MMAERAMQRRFYYMDVHAKGFYPPNILKHWERRGWEMDVTDQDLARPERGLCGLHRLQLLHDLCHPAQGRQPPPTTTARAPTWCGIPLFRRRDWGWQIDPVGLRYALNWMTDRYNPAPVHRGERPGRLRHRSARRLHPGRLPDRLLPEAHRRDEEGGGRGRGQPDGLHPPGAASTW